MGAMVVEADGGTVAEQRNGSDMQHAGHECRGKRTKHILRRGYPPRSISRRRHHQQRTGGCSFEAKPQETVGNSGNVLACLEHCQGSYCLHLFAKWYRNSTQLPDFIPDLDPFA